MQGIYTCKATVHICLYFLEEYKVWAGIYPPSFPIPLCSNTITPTIQIRAPNTNEKNILETTLPPNLTSLWTWMLVSSRSRSSSANNPREELVNYFFVLNQGIITTYLKSALISAKIINWIENRVCSNILLLFSNFLKYLRKNV